MATPGSYGKMGGSISSSETQKSTDKYADYFAGDRATDETQREKRLKNYRSDSPPDFGCLSMPPASLAGRRHVAQIWTTTFGSRSTPLPVAAAMW